MLRQTMFLSALAPILAAGALAGPAWAQPAPAAVDAAVDAVVSCLSVPDGQERLACFNRSAPALRAAPQAAVAPAAPQASAPVAAAPVATAAVAPPPAPRPDQRFGSEQLPRQAPPPSESLEEEMTAKVTTVRQDDKGRLLITLENGQRWQQREDGNLRLRPGDAVTIKPGIFGTYNLVPDGRNATFKVRRVE